ncbi:hypothetical protein M433DRAFT_139528 [Acidomyces richmondensis BFW]|nr:MAG: hypothetical protein FE78DRAFT_106527 [Acidomyces sp. 'richmondensis']KYG50006.1 hypothetical protein M433DRAFT_139528 [Acidomyces richmondensis BFW]
MATCGDAKNKKHSVSILVSQILHFVRVLLVLGKHSLILPIKCIRGTWKHWNQQRRVV